ncbi:MAG: alpha-amylase/alpha-mannosidase [Planctomycetota bacterium]|jgi:alpha-amylase/alpha-mannosidase (GH57 family)
MSTPALVLYWHFHQPNYVHPATGRATMPWVRLHGIKDYWGMAALLEEHPGVRCSFNFVPSLLDQLEACIAGTCTDDYQELARRPAAEYSPADRENALDFFFHAHWDRMVRVHPRYGELLDRRAPWNRTAAEAAGDFSEADLRDLACWSTLAWYHPLAVERDAGLRELVAKGRDFTEAEKLYAIEHQRQVLSEVVPAYRRLAERGQVELTTAPYYHPILPLLADWNSARAALPGVNSPRGWKRLPEDAREHLSRAIDKHRERFGRSPAGCWPSEGSVSEAVVPLLAEAGFRWTATDEEILAYSLGRKMKPEDLHRPYRLDFRGGAVDAVFRDRALSDAIGFVYHGWEDQAAAAADFVSRAAACTGPLVTAVLDGENAWEYYPGGGVPFLRALYSGLEAATAEGRLRTVLPGEYLATNPGDRLSRLWPGSWINHDFYIWAGHRDDQRAWEYLFRTRADLVRLSADPKLGDEQLAAAWESLYAAEGSDWFWWYGDDHDSGNDAAFDELFRAHLAGVYRALGAEAPEFLAEPIGGPHGPLLVTAPSAEIAAEINGQADEDEWLGAGCFRTTAGSMDRSGPPLVDRVLFGSGREDLFLRVDFTASRREEVGPDLEVRFEIAAPREAALAVRGLSPEGQPQIFLDGEPAGRVAWDNVLELAVPLPQLGLAPGGECALRLAVVSGGESLQRVPADDLLRFTLPG